MDKGVLRPEAKGEVVGWREGKEAKALGGFLGGFLFWEVVLLDEVEVDQSMPARSSIVYS